MVGFLKIQKIARTDYFPQIWGEDLSEKIAGKIASLLNFDTTSDVQWTKIFLYRY